MFSDSLKEVLTEMCDCVGADFYDIDFSNDNWYWEYEWTQEEEDTFKEWMVDYLYGSSKARREIMFFPRRTKKHIKPVVNFFLFQYGWKVKNVDKDNKS